ncbi:AAA family ATPase [Pseudoalteromonas phage PS_L5]|nr:AAA family ATPase [Pseudoalteromonas phage PS_L5]
MITSDLIENLQKGNTDFIGEAISNLMNVNKADEKYDHSFDDVGDMVLDACERAYKGESGAVKTGFADIDERLGGWHPSDLVIIAARPAMGKTAFMVNSFLRANASVGVISAEQGAEQIGVRSVCIDSGVNHQNLRRARMDKQEFDRFERGLTEFRMMKSRIFDKPAPTIMEVEKIARQWVFKHDIKAIYIDYAQRLGHENTKLNPVERNSDIAKRLKELARTLNVPVIALAQVNRQCESRADRRPMMGDIADASAYEKEADVIFTLYRDEVYDDETPDKGVIEAIFEKNRHGSTGMVKLSWVGQYMQVNDFNQYEYSQEQDNDGAGYYG